MIYVVIVAGGSGSRMNSSVPKQFLLLNNKPILFHTIKVFQENILNAKIIVVLPNEFIDNDEYKKLLADDFNNIEFVTGGKNRFESVKNGLQAITENEGIVFIHDAVRPFVSKKIIENCMQTAIEKGNAIPCIDIVDSVRIVENNTSSILDRNKIKVIQTPQTFQVTIIKKAFEQPYQQIFTDDASVVETMGEKINLIEGEKNNIKITTPFDLKLAEIILATM